MNLLECHDPLYLCKSSCHLNAGWSQLFNFVTAKVQQLLWVLFPNILLKNVIPLSGFCWKQQVWKHLHTTLSTSYHCKCVFFSFKFILIPFSRDFLIHIHGLFTNGLILFFSLEFKSRSKSHNLAVTRVSKTLGNIWSPRNVQFTQRWEKEICNLCQCLICHAIVYNMS